MNTPTRQEGLRVLFSLLALAIVAIPVAIVAVPLWFLYRLLLRLLVELLWVARGKRVLLIYSKSPVWERYIETNWMPRLEGRAVVLNWSDRRFWNRSAPFTAWVFRHWAPPANFNPGVILFPGFLRTKQIGFYDAFRDFKHGKEAALRAGEAELFAFADALKERGG